jgi:hypothetical protein
VARRKKSTAERERSDQEKLHLFVRKAQELSETKLAQKGIGPGLHYQVDQVSGWSTGLDEPDEDELRSFLVTFRHFISNDEPVFLNSVLNICTIRLISEELKGFIADARKDWANIQRVSRIMLIINGTELPALEVWKIWINGKYFHNDLRYQQLLDQAPPEVLNFLRFNFLSFVDSATHLIAWLHQFVLKALSENMFLFEEISSLS